MSSYKITTKIETVDSYGKAESQSWSSIQTSLTDVVWKNIQVAADARIFVWHPTVWADFTPTNFATLTLVSDGDLDVEATVQFGNASAATNSFRLAADTPYTLGADDAYYARASTTDSAFGGTLGVIDSIRVDEPSSANVNLTMIMGV
jgi:hypothetical protein